MIAILDDAFVSSFRYFGVATVTEVHFPSTFDGVENSMNVGYYVYTVALAVQQEEVHFAPDTTKYVLKGFEHGMRVGVVAPSQHDIGDKIEQLKVVGIVFKKRGKGSKPDLHHFL